MSSSLGGRLARLERAGGPPPCPEHHVRVIVSRTGAFRDAAAVACVRCGRPLRVVRILIARVPSRQRSEVRGQEGEP